MNAPVVYRVYDATDRLIYIGATVDLPNRMRTHRSQSWWHTLAARIHSEPFDNLADARAAEVSAIRAERPAFNQQHTPRLGLRPMKLADDEVRTCIDWLREHRTRRVFLPLSLKWVADLAYPPADRAA